MPLNKDEQQNFADWVDQRSTVEGYSCPVCGHNEVDLERGAITFNREKGEQVDLSDQLPVIISACANCGHIGLFNEDQIDL